MKGIAIKTAKGFLDLPDNLKITLEENSPFQGRDELRSTFTTSFKLPLTPGNSEKLGSPELIENNDVNLRGVDATLYSDGVKISEGFLKMNEATSDFNKRNGGYNVNFLNELAAYADKIEGKTLKDLKLCGVIPIPGDDIQDVTTLLGTLRSEATTDWVTDLMLNNPHPYFTFPSIKVNDATYGYANLWDDNAGKYKVVMGGAFVLGGGLGVRRFSALVPMFYYHQVLRHCFTEFGYFVKGEMIDDAYFQKKVVINNQNIIRERLLELFPSEPEAIVGDLTTLINQEYSQIDTAIEPANHMPEMNISDFLNDFMLKFGTSFTIAGREVTIRIIEKRSQRKKRQGPRYGRQLLKPEMITLAYPYDEIFPDNVPDYVEGVDQKFTAGLKPVWQVEDDQYNYVSPSVSGDKVFTADGRFGINNFPAERWKAVFAGPGPWPATNANRYFTDEEEHECPLMCGIWHGFRSNRSAYEFPYMSRDNRLHNATNDVIGDWALHWNDDAYGLVPVFLTNWLKTFAAAVKDTFYFEDDYLDYLDNQWGTFQIIRNQEYYVAKRAVTLPLRKEVKYECYKIG